MSDPALIAANGDSLREAFGKALSSLTTEQLTFCLSQFANQLSQREGQPAP